MRHVSRWQVHRILLSYAIVPGSGKQTLQSMQDLLALPGKYCCVEDSQFGEFQTFHPASSRFQYRTKQYSISLPFVRMGLPLIGIGGELIF
jgi:hypothetical protein